VAAAPRAAAVAGGDEPRVRSRLAEMATGREPFRDDMIRAIAGEGHTGGEAATMLLAQVLIERRDASGRACLNGFNPVVRFAARRRIEGQTTMPSHSAAARRPTRRTSVLCAATILAAGAAIGMAPAGQDPTAAKPLRLSATAVDMGTVGSGTTSVLEISITRWSTPKERQDLIAKAAAGRDALLPALKAMPFHGRIAIPRWIGPDPYNARLGWDLRYAATKPLEGGGQQITIVTDRFIGRMEEYEKPDALAYPFTLVDISLDKNGKGTGRFAAATNIEVDAKTNQLRVNNYSAEPVRLKNVKIEK